jgi:hypothetical protein
MQGTAGEAEDPATAWDHTDVPLAPSVKTSLRTGLKAEADAAANANRSAPASQGPPPAASLTRTLARSLPPSVRRRVATLLGRR